MSYDLGNTDSITYDGQDVDKLTLDGTTIWEKQTDGYINLTLDGVIYKDPSARWGPNANYYLFFDRLRTRPHHNYKLQGGKYVSSEPPPGQVYTIGKWDKQAQTWSYPGKSFGANVTSSHQMFEQIVTWDGQMPNNTLSPKDWGYKGQMFISYISIGLYGVGRTEEWFWSTSQVDPRDVDRPQDFQKYSSLSSLSQTAVADGTSAGLELEAVVNLDTVSFPQDWYPATSTAGLTGPAGLRSRSEIPAGNDLPFAFSLYQAG